MELDYWQNKLDRFTITEITSGFKNSQKVDTQLISKYAFHYLKTYFDKVDVQKGSITAEFRKIYGLQIADEKKEESTSTGPYMEKNPSPFTETFKDSGKEDGIRKMM